MTLNRPQGSLMDALRDAETIARGRLEAENAPLVVFAVHRRNDLRLVFDDPRAPMVSGLLSPGDRVQEYQSAAHLLSDVQSLADTPGGILYVVFAFKNVSPPPWLFARDFDAQAAANVFTQLKARDAARLEKHQARLRETTTQRAGFGGRGLEAEREF